MNHKRVCLYCGEPKSGLNYNCNCGKSSWTREHRVIDIDMAMNINRRLISESFEQYSFESPEGILQYHGLPYNHILTEISEMPGLTPLHELSSLGLFYGCNLFLKNEADNPSGCFKDRETLLCLLNSEFNGLRKAVIYSSGNAAASAAHFSGRNGRKLIAFVAGDTYPEKIDYIMDHGADVVVIGDDQTNFEAGYRLFSELGELNYFSDHTYDNWSVRNPFRVQGDKTISIEIVKQLSDNTYRPVAPDYVIVPTANGSCLAGIWKGFKELKQAGIISRLPGLIPVGIKNANPVCKAVRLKEINRPVRCDLSKVSKSDMKVGSILVAEEGYDSVEAARAVLESGGFEVELHTSDIRNALAGFLQHEAPLAIEHGILPEPASLTSLAAVEKIHNKTALSPSDVVVSISTGDGMKARDMINCLLPEDSIFHDTVDQISVNNEKTGVSFSRKGQRVNAGANAPALARAFSRLQKVYA